MKKFLKVLFAMILALIIIGGVTFLIDASRVKSEKSPIFVLKCQQLKDGGTTEYFGLGYKVIDFNIIDGYNKSIIGPWTMSFDEEYKKHAENRIDKMNELTPEPEEQNEEIISNPEEIMPEDNPEITNPEEIQTENPDIINETEPIVENTETIPEEIVTENPVDVVEELPTNPEIITPVINATVVGVNQDEIIARVDSFEGVAIDVDMISFINTDSSRTFVKDQAIRIEFDGNINGGYPARINVLAIN